MLKNTISTETINNLNDKTIPYTMKTLTLLKTFALFAGLLLVTATSGWGQGSESFDNLDAPTGSYDLDGSFIGNNDIEWSYNQVRKVTDATYYITDPSAGFPISGDRHIQATISGGIGSLEYKTRSYFTGGGASDRTIRVLVNGNEVDSYTLEAMGTVYTRTIDNIDVAGTFTLRFESTGTRQIIIDDIEWTGHTTDDPLISASPTSLSDFLYYEGEGPSDEKIFTVSGENLEDDITISAPSNYEISETSGADFTDVIVLSETEGEVAEKTIYVRLKSGLTPDFYNETIEITSEGADQADISLTGEVKAYLEVPYSQDFSAFTSIETLPDCWALDDEYAYQGSFGSGTAGGLRGEGVLGFQLTGSAPNNNFNATLTLQNNTGTTITDLAIKYTGKVERVTQTGTPKWVVSVNGTEYPELEYSTEDGVDKDVFFVIPVLSIENEEFIEINWFTTSDGTSGVRRQIGITDLEVKAADVYVLYGAADDASNYDETWDDEDNEGFGFEQWDLTQEGNAGFFIGDPADAGIAGMEEESFGLYANPKNGNFANADRDFISPLQIGSTFSVDWGVNWDSDGDGNKGINLYTGGTTGAEIININMGGSAVITINGDNMFEEYGTQVMTLNFEYVAEGQLRVYGTGRDGSESYDETLLVAGAPDAVRFYASNLNTGDERQPYFNNLQISTDPGVFPASATLIVKGQNDLDTELEVENVIIEDPHNLIINPMGQLTVNGTLSNEGTIIVQSDATGTGSLIHNNTGVQATVERYIVAVPDWPDKDDGAQGWHFVSSPVVNQSIEDDWTPTGEGNDYDFYAWDESPPGTWLNQKVEANDITKFIAGKGYLVAYEVTDTKAFDGELNNGNISITLHFSNTEKAEKVWVYESGWNLIGNPYPSAIDWNVVDHTPFQNVFAYIYDRTAGNGGDYVTIDGESSDAFIPAHQGFFVLADEDPGDFTFTNDMREHGSDFMKSQAANDHLRLRITSDTYYSDTKIRLHPDAIAGTDRYDANKLFSLNPNMPQIYSYTEDHVRVAINSIPHIDQDKPIVIGLRIPADNEYTISAAEISGAFNSSTLLLEDVKTGTIHNLQDNPEYAFEAEEGDHSAALILHFSQMDDPTGIDEVEEGSVHAWYHNNTLFVTNPEERAEVKVFDISGRQMYRFVAGAGEHQYRVNLPAGVYIVHTTTQNSSQSMRIVVSQ